MARIRTHLLTLALVASAFAAPAFGWGLRTHRWINEAAIECVPEPLRTTLREAKERLSDLAVEPDTRLRRRGGPEEATRHYLRIDLYDAPPFVNVPRSRDEAERRVGRGEALERGILPWYAMSLHERMAAELRAGRTQKAIETAGLAGHYVADAFMPLHATENHDGQKTGNDGIHRRVEREVVDPRVGDWRPPICREPEPVTVDRLLDVLRTGHRLLPEILVADREARRSGAPGSAERTEDLAHRLEPILWPRISDAASFLAEFWAGAAPPK